MVHTQRLELLSRSAPARCSEPHQTRPGSGRSPRWLAALALALLGTSGVDAFAHQPPAAPPAAKQTPAPAFDPLRGRDLQRFPPDRPWDHLHMRLEIDIPDLEKQTFVAEATLIMKLASPPVASGDPARPGVRSATPAIRLNARSATLRILSVSIDGLPATFTHQRDLLRIEPPVSPSSAAATSSSPPPGATRTVRIRYQATKPFGTGDDAGTGLNWFTTDPDSNGAGPQLYSQGQANFNSYWFPCHDHPNERLTTELVITLPDGPKVISNGRLVGVTTGAGRATWHWLQDKPHVNYLVMLAIGTFDVVELGGPASARPGLDMPVYGPPGSAQAMRTAFANTPAMVAWLEGKLERKFPWDKYAQVMVRDFRWGGMENTSATILNDRAKDGRAGAHDDLIVHELAHQWFGNLVTCRSWAELWLNEGWATFIEAAWEEHREGAPAYFARVLDARESLASALNGTAPVVPAMRSRRFRTDDSVFEKVEDPYQRGGYVLHMLRELVGDDAFWRAARLYLDRTIARDGLVETHDLRLAFEHASGLSLERFFEQWVDRPGVPRLTIDLGWDEQLRTLNVRVEQTQTIDAQNPAYALRIPIYLGSDEDAIAGLGGPERWLWVQTDERVAQASFKLPRQPETICVDPRGSILGELRVKKP
jgi:aminopeptidase N